MLLFALQNPLKLNGGDARKARHGATCPTYLCARVRVYVRACVRTCVSACALNTRVACVPPWPGQ